MTQLVRHMLAEAFHYIHERYRSHIGGQCMSVYSCYIGKWRYFCHLRPFPQQLTTTLLSKFTSSSSKFRVVILFDSNKRFASYWSWDTHIWRSEKVEVFSRISSEDDPNIFNSEKRNKYRSKSRKIILFILNTWKFVKKKSIKSRVIDGSFKAQKKLRKLSASRKISDWILSQANWVLDDICKRSKWRR